LSPEKQNRSQSGANVGLGSYKVLTDIKLSRESLTSL